MLDTMTSVPCHPFLKGFFLCTGLELPRKANALQFLLFKLKTETGASEIKKENVETEGFS